MAHTIYTFCLGLRLGLPFELFTKGYVVEESPGVIKFTVPGPLEIPHRLYHAIHFLVPYQG